MKNKDERMKIITEMLNGIKVSSGDSLGSCCTPLFGALYLEAAHLQHQC